MEGTRVIITSIVVFFALRAIFGGKSLRSLRVELHCRFTQTESRIIGRHTENVELISANSHCEETEIIDDVGLCQNVHLLLLLCSAVPPWVKKVILRIMSGKIHSQMHSETLVC
uniref:Uncharacterized protein n=1 Tax=Stegastes partitus TaxID=144197 RepID=A0A3B4YXR2_9TELE